eukprot:gene7787-8632_t
MAATLKSFLSIVVFAGSIIPSLSFDVRGVSTAKLSFYNPEHDFTCLDGTVTIPFTYVNDDYCDCPDGSDEPGTAACPNGSFTCKNIGHKQLIIQAGRVNDGVCDCCDGSDEYDSEISCGNNCIEAGKEERERLERERTIAQQGHQLKMGYIEESKEKRLSIEKKTKELRSLLEEQKAKVEELKDAKDRAEANEKEAKEKQDKEFEELKKAREEEQEAKKVEEAFMKLDMDGNGILTVWELSTSTHIVKDITEDEAREKLGAEAVDVTKFFDVWPDLKEIYDSSDVEKKTEEVKEKNKVPMLTPEGSKEKDTNTEKPEYNEETKRLISVADQVRKEHDEMKTQMQNTENDILNNDKILGIDFGDHHEFFSLHGQCFDYTDRDNENYSVYFVRYVYKLCPFDTATQTQKDGGTSTSLGHWGEWQGNPDKYSEMKYKGGQSCWNGPDRSMTVKLHCGEKNEVKSVSEPNRCEYEMDFKTPAACQDPEHLSHTQHEEL